PLLGALPDGTVRLPAGGPLDHAGRRTGAPVHGVRAARRLIRAGTACPRALSCDAGPRLAARASGGRRESVHGGLDAASMPHTPPEALATIRGVVQRCVAGLDQRSQCAPIREAAARGAVSGGVSAMDGALKPPGTDP